MIPFALNFILEHIKPKLLNIKLYNWKGFLQLQYKNTTFSHSLNIKGV